MLADLPVGTRSELELFDAGHEVGAIEVVTQNETEQVHLCYGTKAPLDHDERRFGFSLMTTMLGGGMSSRLFQEVREKRGLVYHIGCYPTLFPDAGALICYAGTRPDNMNGVVSIIGQEYARMAVEGPLDEELTRTKNYVTGNMTLGLESTERRMIVLGKGELKGLPHMELEEAINRYQAVSAREIRALAEEYLTDPVLALIGPVERDALTASI